MRSITDFRHSTSPSGSVLSKCHNILVGGSKHIITVVLAKSNVGVLYLMFSLLHIGFFTHCSVHSCATVALYSFHYREGYFTSAVYWDSGEGGNSFERYLVKLPFSAIYLLEHSLFGQGTHMSWGSLKSEI